MKIILFRPEIPQNTGNILRTCFLTNTKLSIVTPASFSLNQKHLKRAGLDYFKDFEIETIDDLDEYLLKNNKSSFYFFSSKASKYYTDVEYKEDTTLIFGNETSGLPKTYYEKYSDKFLTIPMKKDARCLNLSNSVAIALYEAQRQTGFNF
ncbi:MAG: tRNA (cytidine(34)-2'-O)-methyltransferase [Parachlamydiales bacterium]|nr:tRNA (cytidine(34)-2'-O)-methyltransferase [Parachlamydiales bacterium]